MLNEPHPSESRLHVRGYVTALTDKPILQGVADELHLVIMAVSLLEEASDPSKHYRFSLNQRKIAPGASSLLTYSMR
jgi:hypothetical protein